MHGSGNYVQGNKDGASIYAFFHLETKNGGWLPAASGLSVDRINKPVALPVIGSSMKAYRIRRLHTLHGIDAAAEEIWLDGAAAATFSPEDAAYCSTTFTARHLAS